MTNEKEAIKMLKAKRYCMELETSGTEEDCNNRNCDECPFNYDQGNIGEQKEALDLAIKALEQQPIWVVGASGAKVAFKDVPVDKVVQICAIIGDEQQPCEDCISREAVIRLVEQYPNIIGNRCSGLIADIKHLPSVTPRTNLAETSQDCINREAVLDGLASIAKAKAKSDAQKSLMGRVMFFTEHLPSVTPQQRWIPVSERLPEDGRTVLVWFEYYNGDYNRLFQTFGLSYAYGGKWSEFVNGSSGWKDLRIIAWCELPQPYKENKE